MCFFIVLIIRRDAITWNLMYNENAIHDAAQIRRVSGEARKMVYVIYSFVCNDTHIYVAFGDICLHFEGFCLWKFFALLWDVSYERCTKILTFVYVVFSIHDIVSTQQPRFCLLSIN